MSSGSPGLLEAELSPVHLSSRQNIDHYINRILFSSLDDPLFSLRAHQKYVHLLLRWHGDAFYGVFLLFR